jgi:hypothetical protein
MLSCSTGPISIIPSDVRWEQTLDLQINLRMELLKSHYLLRLDK